MEYCGESAEFPLTIYNLQDKIISFRASQEGMSLKQKLINNGMLSYWRNEILIFSINLVSFLLKIK